MLNIKQETTETKRSYNTGVKARNSQYSAQYDAPSKLLRGISVELQGIKQVNLN